MKTSRFRIALLALAALAAAAFGVYRAFLHATPLQTVAAAEGADLVLCMSIHPGYSGQAFMPEALERISRLRELLPADVRVQVDGGINADTIVAVREAGADLLVCGSAIFWNDDPAAAFRELTQTVSGRQHA